MTIERQLGLLRAPLTREPDIIIRFVDQLSTSARVRYLGGDDVGFMDDACLVLGGKQATRSIAQIPFEQIGRRCEIVCRHGLSTVPLLLPILNLTVLYKGAIPLHASAFTYDGIGVLTAGWSHGGKTGTLLAFMSRGAQYIGDDWVYLGDTGRMYGLPAPIEVKERYLHDLPHYRVRIEQVDRMRLWAFRLARAMAQPIVHRSAAQSLLIRLLNRGMRTLEARACVQLAPRQLFSHASCAFTGTLDKIFFVISHNLPGLSVQPMDSQLAAHQIGFALQHERLNLLSYYLKFRFAFPELQNERLEQADELQRAMLLQALTGKQAYAVYHPYPVSTAALFEAISPFCRP